MPSTSQSENSILEVLNECFRTADTANAFANVKQLTDFSHSAVNAWLRSMDAVLNTLGDDQVTPDQVKRFVSQGVKKVMAGKVPDWDSGSARDIINAIRNHFGPRERTPSVTVSLESRIAAIVNSIFGNPETAAANLPAFLETGQLVEHLLNLEVAIVTERNNGSHAQAWNGQSDAANLRTLVDKLRKHNPILEKLIQETEQFKKRAYKERLSATAKPPIEVLTMSMVLSELGSTAEKWDRHIETFRALQEVAYPKRKFSDLIPVAGPKSSKKSRSYDRDAPRSGAKDTEEASKACATCNTMHKGDCRLKDHPDACHKGHCMNSEKYPIYKSLGHESLVFGKKLENGKLVYSSGKYDESNVPVLLTEPHPREDATGTTLMQICEPAATLEREDKELNSSINERPAMGVEGTGHPNGDKAPVVEERVTYHCGLILRRRI